MKKIEAMEEVGIGYVTLGQALSTLSGGECQRLKLANELHKKGRFILWMNQQLVYMSDIEHILTIIHSLVNKGNTVIVIEHNVDIIRNADWIIDLGPEGGSAGGQIIFEGAPLDLLENKQSLTAKYL